mmetsp:Transcript_17232/g.51756  ORF Transcript_17232/g.51756 Transcript_17232/m.51756 type:complete len:204 (-) Transcript_17232:341-952(-)
MPLAKSSAISTFRRGEGRTIDLLKASAREHDISSLMMMYGFCFVHAPRNCVVLGCAILRRIAISVRKSPSAISSERFSSLAATRLPCHLALYTSPNSPLPIFSTSVSSLGLTSHSATIPTGFKVTAPWSFEFSSLTKSPSCTMRPPLSTRSFTTSVWSLRTASSSGVFSWRSMGLTAAPSCSNHCTTEKEPSAAATWSGVRRS